MALNAGSVSIKAKVEPVVGVGKSTVVGGSVSLISFVLAAYAYAQGARDEATIGALVAGVVIGVTTLAGRFAQAVAAILAARKVPPTFEPIKDAVVGELSRFELDQEDVDRIALAVEARLRPDVGDSRKAPAPGE